MQPPITDYEQVITFGKYKGKTIDWIAENNPGYIVWLHEENVCEVDGEILEAAQFDDAQNGPPEEWFLERD